MIWRKIAMCGAYDAVNALFCYVDFDEHIRELNPLQKVRQS